MMGNLPIPYWTSKPGGWLFQNIDVGRGRPLFRVQKPVFSMRFSRVFRPIGNEVPNMAIVWNYKDKTCFNP